MPALSMYDKLLSVITKVPEARVEFECQELVPWFRNKCVLLESLKHDIVTDVIRYCEFERKKKDDVLIKQGENGDKLYIILKGAVSIYVIQDKDTPQDVLQEVEKACSRPDLDRAQLGQYVWFAGEGKSVGEIALLKDDCIRTASVVADCDTDLVVIDRTLYNRSVRDVLEREFQQKTKFVEENVLFRQWSPKQKKHLVVALKKENVKYGFPLTKQGTPAENLFFILSGEVEITCDQSQFKSQYVELWREMEHLLPGLLPRSKDRVSTPHQSMKNRLAHHKLLQMCLLGTNELIGALEFLVGLTTSLENANVTREADVLLLSKENFDRLFYKKHSANTIQILRERLTMRLYLYINRSEHDKKTPLQKSAFLRFLSFMLQDENALQDLKKMKRKERERPDTVTGVDLVDNGRSNKESQEMANMLKMLDMKHSTVGRLPSMGSSEKVIKDIEAGLKSWVDRSKGTHSPEIRGSPRLRQKTFHGSNELLKPDFHQTRSLTRSKTPDYN